MNSSFTTLSDKRTVQDPSFGSKEVGDSAKSKFHREALIEVIADYLVELGHSNIKIDEIASIIEKQPGCKIIHSGGTTGAHCRKLIYEGDKERGAMVIAMNAYFQPFHAKQIKKYFLNKFQEKVLKQILKAIEDLPKVKRKNGAVESKCINLERLSEETAKFIFSNGDYIQLDIQSYIEEEKELADLIKSISKTPNFISDEQLSKVFKGIINAESNNSILEKLCTDIEALLKHSFHSHSSLVGVCIKFLKFIFLLPLEQTKQVEKKLEAIKNDLHSKIFNQKVIMQKHLLQLGEGLFLDLLDLLHDESFVNLFSWLLPLQATQPSAYLLLKLNNSDCIALVYNPSVLQNNKSIIHFFNIKHNKLESLAPFLMPKISQGAINWEVTNLIEGEIKVAPGINQEQLATLVSRPAFLADFFEVKYNDFKVVDASYLPDSIKHEDIEHIYLRSIPKSSIPAPLFEIMNTIFKESKDHFFSYYFVVDNKLYSKAALQDYGDYLAVGPVSNDNFNGECWIWSEVPLPPSLSAKDQLCLAFVKDGQIKQTLKGQLIKIKHSSIKDGKLNYAICYTLDEEGEVAADGEWHPYHPNAFDLNAKPISVVLNKKCRIKSTKEEGPIWVSILIGKGAPEEDWESIFYSSKGLIKGDQSPIGAKIKWFFSTKNIQSTKIRTFVQKKIPEDLEVGSLNRYMNSQGKTIWCESAIGLHLGEMKNGWPQGIIHVEYHPYLIKLFKQANLDSIAPLGENLTVSNCEFDSNKNFIFTGSGKLNNINFGGEALKSEACKIVKDGKKELGVNIVSNFNHFGSGKKPMALFDFGSIEQEKQILTNGKSHCYQMPMAIHYGKHILINNELTPVGKHECIYNLNALPCYLKLYGLVGLGITSEDIIGKVYTVKYNGLGNITSSQGKFLRPIYNMISQGQTIADRFFLAEYFEERPKENHIVYLHNVPNAPFMWIHTEEVGADKKLEQFDSLYIIYNICLQENEKNVYEVELVNILFKDGKKIEENDSVKRYFTLDDMKKIALSSEELKSFSDKFNNRLNSLQSRPDGISLIRKTLFQEITNKYKSIENLATELSKISFAKETQMLNSVRSIISLLREINK